MTGRVEGKVAFITGAARGQGRSHAVRLAQEGADIIGLDVCANTGFDYEASTTEDLAETVRQVEALGRRMHTGIGDVRDYESVSSILAAGVERFGKVDIVLANAGIANSGKLSHEWSDQEWRTMIDTNLTGVWNTTKAATPYFIEQGTGGSMVITSSLAGMKGARGCVGYVASKWGVLGITKSLARELAEYRVRVNAVSPTNVETPMLDNPMMYKVFRPDLEAPTLDDAIGTYATINLWPIPWIQPVDVSNMILFLASEEGRYITGAVLPIDLGASVL